MDINEQKKKLGELQKQIDNLMKLQDDAFSKLPKEQYAQIEKYHIDANKMVRGMKKGDFEGIQNLLKKYTKLNDK